MVTHWMGDKEKEIHEIRAKCIKFRARYVQVSEGVQNFGYLGIMIIFETLTWNNKTR